MASPPDRRQALAGRTVMVLDAEQRSALAAIRSLGRAGAKVVSVSADPDAIDGQSK